jgi:putative ABC transport system substrate-binding protein
LKRRDFIAALGAVAAVPNRAFAQPAKVPTIGVLALGTPDPQPIVQVVLQELKNLGYRDGENIRLEIRSAAGQTSALSGFADELVRLKVNIILAYHTPAATAARKATSEIPIVMLGVGDPLGTGLIASLAKPGGNVTGTAAFGSELGAKTIELVRDVLPSARRIAAMVTVGDPFTKPFLDYTKSGGQKTGIEIDPIMLPPGGDFDAAFEDMRSKKIDAIIVQPTLLRPGFSELALKHRLPSFSLSRLLPLNGGLMSYAAKQDDMIRNSVLYVDRILKGANPADLPVAQPSTFEMVINLKTAKALGLDISPALVARADEVID